MQSEPVSHTTQAVGRNVKSRGEENIERITGVSQTKIESQAEVQKAEKIHQYSRKDSGLERFWTSRGEKKKTPTLCRLGV